MISRAIVDRVPHLLWTYSADGVADYVNAAWTEYTGIREATAASTLDWECVLPATERTSFAAGFDGAMIRVLRFCDEFSIQSRDGEMRRHSIVIEPVWDALGHLTAWLGSATDVEDLRRIESSSAAREREYKREITRSAIFQRAVLPPHLPKVAGLSFDAIYEPGLSEAKVGGDWYDAVRLLDGRVLVTIGDVAGHGVHAAVIMGVVRQIMRGIAQLHADPATMLDAADRALAIEYPDVIVTAWVGVFDLIERTLTYASAGHPPPLLLAPDGGVRELDHLTLPIGLREGHQGITSIAALENGTVVWLYTDGLIEATHDIIAGLKTLHRTAHRLGMQTVVHPAATIRHLVIPNGSPDDVAILVVKTNFNEAETSFSRWNFDSMDGEHAAETRCAFAAALPSISFSPSHIANAVVVLGELCGNVARYAEGSIDVVLDQTGRQAVLHVLDRGVGFRHLSRLPNDPFSETGRGLYIVSQLTTEFTVTQRDGGGSHARAVLIGRYPASLLREPTARVHPIRIESATSRVDAVS
jgi:PAS domain S-box-containing protein